MKKQIILILALVLPLLSMAKSQENKDTDKYRYDLECAGNGSAGTYLVKVWSYSKKADVAENQCRKNAVHGVLFKGYGSGTDCIGQRALLSNPGAETENAEYFKSFFADGGEFQKYASIIGGTTETTKIGKEYKVGVVVSVRKDDLRRAMEAAGILQSLGFGF